jgi:hypothetical protein
MPLGRILKGRHSLPITFITLLPILSSILVITGVFKNDPRFAIMRLTSALHQNSFWGAWNWVDPTIGFITQPLGMLSADDWLHGIVPWWNPYSGVGMPLAAEMQTLSLFLPFVLILKYWQGWLALKIILQILSGLFTYALLIQMRMTRLAAISAAALYALNATFFLDPHVMGPMAFGPLLLLGIERAYDATIRQQKLGWALIPPAVAYLIYSGYPEVAYIEGLLGVVWTLWRFALAGAARWRFLAKIALGGILGIGLALPILVPFFEYVHLSFLGKHAQQYSEMSIRFPNFIRQVFPYLFGPVGTPLAPHPFKHEIFAVIYWMKLSDWLGPVATILALASLIRPSRFQGLQWVLFGVIAVWEARIFGFPPVIWAINQIPLLAQTDSVRFCGPTIELASFIMVAIAIDTWQRRGGLGRIASNSLIAGFLAMSVLALLPIIHLIHLWVAGRPNLTDFILGATALGLVSALTAIILLSRTPRRHTAILLGLVISCSAVADASITQLGAPRQAKLDVRGVMFLKRHLGFARFYTLGPLGPNYPAAFHLASINDNALPVALSWDHFIHKNLDPYADVILFTGDFARLPRQKRRFDALHHTDRGAPDQAAELRHHLKSYENIGVRYIAALSNQNPFNKSIGFTKRSGPLTPLALAPGGVLQGDISANAIKNLRHIDQVDILIGTYHGAASGHLVVTLCRGHHCRSGRGDLKTASDGAYLAIPLDQPLAMRRSQSLSIKITHPRGGTVAIWFGTPQSSGMVLASTPPALHGLNPVIRLVSLPAPPRPTLVFHNAVMRLYQLPHTRALFSASNACQLTIRTWQRVDAHCPVAATLTWLEADFPGWHATIDGRSTPIKPTGDIFQSITLPIGASHINFFYRPPGIRRSCAIAFAALVIWLAAIAHAKLGVTRRR